MRSTTLAATLLSLGVFAGAPSAHAAPRVVLDTITGSTAEDIAPICDDATSISVSWCDPVGCLAFYEDVPTGGMGVMVHADAPMTITRIAASFRPYGENGGALASGPGFFSISDANTQRQIWRKYTNWSSSAALTADVSVGGAQVVNLERGHDYIVAFTASSYLGFADPIPPRLCSAYRSVVEPQVPGLLEPTAYSHMFLDDGLTSTAHQAAWSYGTVYYGRAPAFVVEAVIGDSDGDAIADDVDNCVDTANAAQKDFDYDGVGDACDNCPFVNNPDQSSCSGLGGGGGSANPDGDGDGVLDVRDNCPFVANAGQLDADHDGTGDACDGAAADAGGCSVVGASPSLLIGLALLAARRRRRSR